MEEPITLEELAGGCFKRKDAKKTPKPRKPSTSQRHHGKGEPSDSDYVPEKVSQRLNEIKALLKLHKQDREKDAKSEDGSSSATDEDLTGLKDHFVRNEKAKKLNIKMIYNEKNSDGRHEDRDDLNFILENSTIEGISKETKIRDILSLIEADKRVADFKIGSYIVACDEFRTGVRLRPAPPTYDKDKTSAQNRMMTTNDEIPKLNELTQRLHERFNYSQDLIDTLYWLLVQRNDPSLETVPMCDYQELINATCLQSFTPPSLMLKLTYSPKRLEGSYWEDYSTDNTMWAMLPVKGDYLHPLVHEGLKFVAVHDGPGLLVTNKFMPCFKTTTLSKSWKKSSLASKFKTVVLVEFMRHSSIMCYNEKGEETGAIGSRSERDADHFIISDPKLAIARYICIYTQNKPFGDCLIAYPPSIFLGMSRKSLLFILISLGSIALSSVGIAFGYKVLSYVFGS